MGIAWTIARKDLALLIRDRMGLFWVLAFPLVYALFFGSIFGGGPDQKKAALRVAVDDRDQTTASKKFYDRFAASKSLRVEIMPRDEAKDLVRQGKLVAFLVLEKGFGEPSALFAGTARLELGVDPSRQAEQGFLQGIIMESYFQGMAEQFTDPKIVHEQMQKSLAAIDNAKDMAPLEAGLLKTMLGSIDQFMTKADANVVGNGPKFSGPKIETTAVDFEDAGPHSAFEITFPSAILWGILGCSASFAISLVSERVEGTFFRLKVAPISRRHILAGKGLACFLACMATQILLLTMAALFFGVKIRHPFLLAVGIVSTATCFVGIMMVVSTLGKTQQSVAGAGWALNTVMAMLGGAMVPLMAMPDWMFKLGSISPVKWGILAMEGAIWRNYTLEEMLLPCGILVGVGIAGFLVGTRILQRADA